MIVHLATTGTLLSSAARRQGDVWMCMPRSNELELISFPILISPGSPTLPCNLSWFGPALRPTIRTDVVACEVIKPPLLPVMNAMSRMHVERKPKGKNTGDKGKGKRWETLHGRGRAGVPLPSSGEMGVLGGGGNATPRNACRPKPDRIRVSQKSSSKLIPPADSSFALASSPFESVEGLFFLALAMTPAFW